MKKVAILFIVSLVLLSCESVKVVSDFDKSVDFTKYKTLEYYGWAKNSDEILNSLNKGRIEQAFANEFEKRGVKVVKENADIVVALYIVTKEKTEKTATTTHMGSGYGGYGYGYRHYGYGPSWGWGGGTSYTTVNEEDYTVGTLVVAVYDAAEKKLVWQSVGKKTINENTKNRDERINKSVAKIMSKYPVEPIKK